MLTIHSFHLYPLPLPETKPSPRIIIIPSSAIFCPYQIMKYIFEMSLGDLLEDLGMHWGPIPARYKQQDFPQVGLLEFILVYIYKVPKIEIEYFRLGYLK